MHDLTQQARDRQNDAYRPSTWNNYMCTFNLYTQFLHYMRLPPFMPDMKHIWAYTQLLVNSGYAGSSIRNHLSTIKLLWNILDLPTDIPGTHNWRTNIKSVESVTRREIRRPAITTADLMSLIAFCRLRLQFLMLRVALVLGCFGCFRISNLAPRSTRDFDPTHHTHDDY